VNSARLGASASKKRILTNYEREFITALEGGIRRWEVLALYFEQKVPEVEIHGTPKMSGREFASNLRVKSDQYRELIERIKNS
jgi:hypothetical protein